MKLLTYLNFGGNCREAFRFYEKHLGGKILMVMTRAEVPDAKDVPPERQNDIVHARMRIGETELLASDVPTEAHYQPMRSAYLSLALDKTEDAERVYHLLAEGDETFFAFRFAMLRDRFGTNWMITHPRPMQHS